MVLTAPYCWSRSFIQPFNEQCRLRQVRLWTTIAASQANARQGLQRKSRQRPKSHIDNHQRSDRVPSLECCVLSWLSVCIVRMYVCKNLDNARVKHRHARAHPQTWPQRTTVKGGRHVSQLRPSSFVLIVRTGIRPNPVEQKLARNRHDGVLCTYVCDSMQAWWWWW